MNESDIALVANWIKHYESSKLIYDDFDDSGDLLEDLFEAYPRRALQIMYLVADKSENKIVLSNLGAGPLENFMDSDKHSIYIDEIIAHADSDRNWRYALGCVWTHGFKNREIASKIEKNLDRLLPNGRP